MHIERLFLPLCRIHNIKLNVKINQLERIVSEAKAVKLDGFLSDYFFHNIATCLCFFALTLENLFLWRQLNNLSTNMLAFLM